MDTVYVDTYYVSILPLELPLELPSRILVRSSVPCCRYVCNPRSRLSQLLKAASVCAPAPKIWAEALYIARYSANSYAVKVASVGK